MWARVSVWLLVAACYSPKPVPGTPCTPAIANCPGDQFCALVDGDYYCVEELPTDARPIDEVPNDGAIDAPPPDGAIANWTLVRTSGAMGNDTTSAATAAGSTIIVGIETDDTDAVDTLTDNANNTYVRVLGSRATTADEDLGIELWYAKNSLAGATRITATGDTIFAVVMWEVAGLHPTVPLGTVARLQEQNATQSPSGAPITTATPGEFVVSIAIVGNAVSGLETGSAFTNDHFTFGNGWAHLTSATAPSSTYTARWDQPSAAAYCATTASFRRAP